MDSSDRKRWLRAVALLGAVYFIVGVAFSAFGRWSASDSLRETWNRLAFLASGIALMVHIGYEYFRLGNSPSTTASHASIAVAVGAFLLALKANIHDLGSASGYRPRMLIALVAWPVLTAVPVFVVALVVAAALGITRARA